MATDKDFIEYITDQMAEAGKITYRKMFGEYAVYLNGKVVALVCDNKLFVKPTEGGGKFIGNVVEAPAYPGAKMSFLIEEGFEDTAWLSELMRITAENLPEPKNKKKGTKNRGKGEKKDRR
ncbi:TfoX/Sxy family protein [candidate division WOR-3 bacterium]|nr:TfoX/Sxy family protein [candidate division WOR-3 bacterium]